jgi:hypothetical protein
MRQAISLIGMLAMLGSVGSDGFVTQLLYRAPP